MLHPEIAPFVSLLVPAADAAGRTSSYRSLKNALRAWIYCYIDQGNAATILLSVLQATDVAGAGSKVLTNVTKIWSNEDLAAAQDITKQTDAKNLTTDANLKNKLVIFEVDPAVCMDVAGNFDAIAVSTGASNVANITSAFLVYDPKYPGANTPSTYAD